MRADVRNIQRDRPGMGDVKRWLTKMTLASGRNDFALSQVNSKPLMRFK